MTEVTIGHRNNRIAEVISGLSAGDRVVLHPSDKISKGVAVKQRETQWAWCKVVPTPGSPTMQPYGLGITRGDIRIDALAGAGFIALGLAGDALLKRNK